MAQNTPSRWAYRALLFVSAPLRGLFRKETPMSNPPNELLPSGLYMFEKAVVPCRAYPFDLLSVRHDLPDRYQLQRYLDGYDIAAILEADAIRPIPSDFELALPPRRWIRSVSPVSRCRRVASLRRSPRL